MRDLEGKVAVVTGAASGMGRAFAERFARAGMRVVMADVEAAPLEAATRAIEANGQQAIGVVTDVSKAESVERLAGATLDAFGKVHLVCNNAGVSGGKGHARFFAYDDPPAIWEATLHDWQWITGVNYWGVAHGIRIFVPIMLAQGEPGHVVNTASVSGLVPGGNVYGATKHAVVSMSESLRFDLQRRGAQIGVTCLCPTLVSTGLYNSYRNRPAELQDRTAGMPGDELARLRDAVARGIDPADVAELVYQAVLEDEFYVVTNHSVDARVRERMEEILNRRELGVAELSR
jgi:NAD(P)-dependent dehydrogenase (short-subunit alcohol dehydrogenase family)